MEESGELRSLCLDLMECRIGKRKEKKGTSCETEEEVDWLLSESQRGS
jgi:hypothetical protein